MRKIENLIQKTLSNNSAFMSATISAVVILVGDVIATGTDLLWLIGDMSVQTHVHHYPVLIGLVIALIIMLLSGVWLIKALMSFFNKKESKCSLTKVYSVLSHNEQLNFDIVERKEELRKAKEIDKYKDFDPQTD